MECACGRWIHEKCINKVVIDTEGKQVLFLLCYLVIFACIHSNACMQYWKFLASLIYYLLSSTFLRLKLAPNTKCNARQLCHLVPSGVTEAVYERQWSEFQGDNN